MKKCLPVSMKTELWLATLTSFTLLLVLVNFRRENLEKEKWLFFPNYKLDLLYILYLNPTTTNLRSIFDNLHRMLWCRCDVPEQFWRQLDLYTSCEVRFMLNVYIFNCVCLYVFVCAKWIFALSIVLSIFMYFVILLLYTLKWSDNTENNTFS